jgi:hypothetical protein
MKTPAEALIDALRITKTEFVLLVICLLLAGCGDNGPGSTACQLADTSRAPDQIIDNGTTQTYVWGDCRISYAK